MIQLIVKILCLQQVFERINHHQLLFWVLLFSLIPYFWTINRNSNKKVELLHNVLMKFGCGIFASKISLILFMYNTCIISIVFNMVREAYCYLLNTVLVRYRVTRSVLCIVFLDKRCCCCLYFLRSQKPLRSKNKNNLNQFLQFYIRV